MINSGFLVTRIRAVELDSGSEFSVGFSNAFSNGVVAEPIRTRGSRLVQGRRGRQAAPVARARQEIGARTLMSAKMLLLDESVGDAGVPGQVHCGCAMLCLLVFAGHWDCLSKTSLLGHTLERLKHVVIVVAPESNRPRAAEKTETRNNCADRAKPLQ